MGHGAAARRWGRSERVGAVGLAKALVTWVQTRRERK